MPNDRDESNRQIARRERRTAGDRSSKLAHELMSVPATTLKKLELDEALHDAVAKAQKVTSNIARRRAERSLAGDLRGVDLKALAAKLATVKATGSAEPEQLHLAEKWRTRMLDEGLAAAAEFPGGVTDALSRLIAEAKRERASGKPPGAQRALFRHLVATLKADAAGHDTDPADDDQP